MKTGSIIIISIIISVLRLQAQGFDVDIDKELKFEDTGKEKFRFGLSLGYNRSLHDFNSLPIADDYCKSCFAHQSGNGVFIGLAFEYMLNYKGDSQPSIVAKLGYETLPAYNTDQGPVQPIWVVNPYGELSKISATTNFEHQIKYSMLSLDLLYKIKLPGTGIWLSIGPTLNYILTRDIKSRFDIIDPQAVYFVKPADYEEKGYTYENNNRTVIYENNVIDNANQIRVGLLFGLQYEIKFDSFYINPAVFYNFGSRNLTSNEEDQVTAWFFGFDFLYSI